MSKPYDGAEMNSLHKANETESAKGEQQQVETQVELINLLHDISEKQGIDDLPKKRNLQDIMDSVNPSQKNILYINKSPND